METEDKVTKTHHYLVLDSLRGICACIVALFHFRTQGVIANLPLVTNGYLFVDFFFVLSGFVISASYRRKLADGMPIASFLGLRLGRIYPLHLFMLVVFVAFEIFFELVMPHAADRQPFTGNNAPEGIIYGLLLVQIFVGAAAQWNIPSWSIASEFWTYAIFAIIYRSAGRVLIPICMVLAAGGLIILSVTTDRYLNVFHDWALIRSITGFSLGVVAERSFQRMPTPRKSVATFMEIILLVVLLYYCSKANGVYTLAAPLIFTLIVLIFAGQAGWLSRILMTWPLIYIGSLSYSIYMLHYFIQLRMVNALDMIERRVNSDWQLVAHVDGSNTIAGGEVFGDMMSVVMLAVVIGVAYLTYKFIELPGQRFSRAKILGKRAQPRRA